MNIFRKVFGKSDNNPSQNNINNQPNETERKTNNTFEKNKQQIINNNNSDNNNNDFIIDMDELENLEKKEKTIDFNKLLLIPENLKNKIPLPSDGFLSRISKNLSSMKNSISQWLNEVTLSINSKNADNILDVLGFDSDVPKEIDKKFLYLAKDNPTLKKQLENFDIISRSFEKIIYITFAKESQFCIMLNNLLPIFHSDTISNQTRPLIEYLLRSAFYSILKKDLEKNGDKFSAEPLTVIIKHFMSHYENLCIQAYNKLEETSETHLLDDTLRKRLQVQTLYEMLFPEGILSHLKPIFSSTFFDWISKNSNYLEEVVILDLFPILSQFTEVLFLTGPKITEEEQNDSLSESIMKIVLDSSSTDNSFIQNCLSDIIGAWARNYACYDNPNQCEIFISRLSKSTWEIVSSKDKKFSTLKTHFRWVIKKAVSLTLSQYNHFITNPNTSIDDWKKIFTDTAFPKIVQKCCEKFFDFKRMQENLKIIDSFIKDYAPNEKNNSLSILPSEIKSELVKEIALLEEGLYTESTLLQPLTNAIKELFPLAKEEVIQKAIVLFIGTHSKTVTSYFSKILEGVENYFFQTFENYKEKKQSCIGYFLNNYPGSIKTISEYLISKKSCTKVIQANENVNINIITSLITKSEKSEEEIAFLQMLGINEETLTKEDLANDTIHITLKEMNVIEKLEKFFSSAENNKLKNSNSESLNRLQKKYKFIVEAKNKLKNIERDLEEIIIERSDFFFKIDTIIYSISSLLPEHFTNKIYWKFFAPLANKTLEPLIQNFAFLLELKEEKEANYEELKNKLGVNLSPIISTLSLNMVCTFTGPKQSETLIKILVNAFPSLKNLLEMFATDLKNMSPYEQQIVSKYFEALLVKMVLTAVEKYQNTNKTKWVNDFFSALTQFIKAKTAPEKHILTFLGIEKASDFSNYYVPEHLQPHFYNILVQLLQDLHKKHFSFIPDENAVNDAKQKVSTTYGKNATYVLDLIVDSILKGKIPLLKTLNIPMLEFTSDKVTGFILSLINWNKATEYEKGDDYFNVVQNISDIIGSIPSEFTELIQSYTTFTVYNTLVQLPNLKEGASLFIDSIKNNITESTYRYFSEKAGKEYKKRTLKELMNVFLPQLMQSESYLLKIPKNKLDKYLGQFTANNEVSDFIKSYITPSTLKEIAITFLHSLTESLSQDPSEKSVSKEEKKVQEKLGLQLLGFASNAAPSKANSSLIYLMKKTKMEKRVAQLLGAKVQGLTSIEKGNTPGVDILNKILEQQTFKFFNPEAALDKKTLDSTLQKESSLFIKALFNYPFKVLAHTIKTTLKTIAKTVGIPEKTINGISKLLYNVMKRLFIIQLYHFIMNSALNTVVYIVSKMAKLPPPQSVDTILVDLINGIDPKKLEPFIDGIEHSINELADYVEKQNKEQKEIEEFDKKTWNDNEEINIDEESVLKLD